MRQNVNVTGGGPGIMEAANRGATDAGAPSIGFNIVLPNEQEPNRFTTPDLTFRFHYFGIRKMHFAIEIVDTAEEAWSVMVGRGLMAHTPLREA